MVVVILRLGREVILPITFAVLLVFMLAPTVVRLSRWGLHKALAILVTVGLALALTVGVGWLIADQAIRLGKELPSYEQNLQAKIAALKAPHAPVALVELGSMIDKLGKQITAPNAEVPIVAGDPPADLKPVPVEVRTANASPLALARDILMPVLSPLGTVGIVLVFVVAMLFQREDLRDRFIKLISSGQINVATQAVDDASERVSRYLWMQLIVNATYGIPVGLGLYFIGVPNALLWGVIATILRFIPYIGPWIAAAFPVVLAIVIDPGWTKFMYTLGLFMVMELVSNNVIEVVLYGASTGISNIALLVAAVFWTWLWGIGGLVLSTPLTVCLLVMGKYVPGLGGLSVLLGSEPVLEPPAQMYQRMLSMESEDMVDLATKYIEEHSLEQFYEEVLSPALILAEEDRHSGALTESREAFIFQAGRDLIEELERRDELTAAKADKAAGAPAPMVELPAAPVIVGLPARDAADELVALMLGHLLRRRRIATAVFGVGGEVENASACITQQKVKVAFISALPPSALVGARQMCRRISARHPDLTVVVGVWTQLAKRDELKERLAMPQAPEVVTSLTDAVTFLERLSPARPASPQVLMPAAEVSTV